MAKAMALLAIILLISISIMGSNSHALPSPASPGSRNEERYNENENENRIEESAAAQTSLGSIQVRSLPPQVFASPIDHSPQSPYPFMPHLSALKTLINTSAADLGIADEVRNKILKYYYLSGLESAGQQVPHQIGTLIHSQQPLDARSSLQPLQSSSSSLFPLRESEIRRLISRFTGHPIEILLRRALRASRNDLARGRRYKAIPDTSFIRFGRSGRMNAAAMDSDPERIGPAIDLAAIPQEETSDDLIFNNNNNSPYESDPYPLANMENMASPEESSDSILMKAKKGKPATYYLRFG